MLCFVIVAIIDMLQFSGATRWHTTTQRPSCSQRHAVLAKKEMFVDEL